MHEFTLRHPIACSPARNWELFLDPAWIRSLYLGGLGFASCEVGPLREQGDLLLREMAVTPKLRAPAAVVRLFGPRLGYRERGRFDTRTQTWSYELELDVLTSRVRLGGRVVVEPAGDNRCTRVSTCWIDIRLPGLGGIVERTAEDNLRDGWNRSAEWINAWLVAQST